VVVRFGGEQNDVEFEPGGSEIAHVQRAHLDLHGLLGHFDVQPCGPHRLDVRRPLIDDGNRMARADEVGADAAADRARAQYGDVRSCFHGL
jgi:hypothetical protein